MTIKELSHRYEDYIIRTRRHFHMHPELSMEEYETTDYIVRELENLGIPFERPTATGVIATLQGNAPGRTVGLRADIDALNVTEKKEVPWKSKNIGKMHACGHDAHAAMLLGAAHILHDLRGTFKGTVKLIFQPAEELGSGASHLMAAGDWHRDIENFFGAHIWSVMPSGKISVEAGSRMAAADWWEIDVTGKSGHGSMPHQGVDAALIASAIVMNLQSLTSRETSPLDSLVVTVGTIQAGTRFNIIAGDAHLSGTNRYFSKAIAGHIEADMRRIAAGTAELYRGSAALTYHYVTPPLINDEASSALAKTAALKIFEDADIVIEPATTGGEDFAYYIQDKPGCFAFIGCADPAKGTDVAHHHECFDIDESVLASGSALYAQYAVDFLSQDS